MLRHFNFRARRSGFDNGSGRVHYCTGPVGFWKRGNVRNNKFITDEKWNTKKRLKSMRAKAEDIAARWGDMDFFVMQMIEDELIAKIDEIIEIVDGVDAKSH